MRRLASEATSILRCQDIQQQANEDIALPTPSLFLCATRITRASFAALIGA